MVPKNIPGSLVESQVRFSRVREKVPGRLWCRARSQGSGEGSEEVSGEGLEALVRCQVRFNGGFGEGSGEGLGGFGAELGQAQQGSEKVPVKVWEALVQS